VVHHIHNLALNAFSYKFYFLAAVSILKYNVAMSKLPAYIILVFGMLLLVGGLFGYMKAHSMVSLASGISFFTAFLISGIALLKNKVGGAYFAFLSSVAVFCLFLVRFILSQKFFPAGAILFLSLPVMYFSISAWFTLRKKKA